MSGASRLRTLILVLIVLLVLVVLFFLLRPGSPESDEAADAPETREQMIALVVEGGAMTPDEVSVEEDDHVHLQVASDQPVEFHIHGYDIEEEVEPDEPAEIAFDATMSGRFVIEDHVSDTELGVLLVQPR